MGDRSRGRFATPADSPLHDGTPCRGLHARRWGLGFVHRSRAILCRPVPNPKVTIRTCCIAGEAQAYGGRGDRAAAASWPVIQGPVDVVLFEGWMLGFTAVPAEQAAAVSPELVPVNEKLREYAQVRNVQRCKSCANRNSEGLARRATGNGREGQIPNVRGVGVQVGTGYHRVEGGRRASRNGRVSDLPPEIPNVTILATFASL